VGQFPLKLSEGPEDVAGELPPSRGRIDSLGKGNKVYAPSGVYCRFRSGLARRF
jgi:hypothetical protein